jgi:hypothetical protein
MEVTQGSLPLRQRNYQGDPTSIEPHQARVPVLFELYDLYGQGLVNCGKIALLSIPDIVPASIRLQGAGAMLFKLMELKWLWADPGEVTSLMILLS